jgi:hypothetical protein
LTARQICIEEYRKAAFAGKATWRQRRAKLSFAEKLVILDELKQASSVFARKAKSGTSQFVSNLKVTP